MMDNAKATVDRLLAVLFDRKKPSEAEKQTPHDVLADALAELDLLRDKSTSLGFEVDDATAALDAAAIDDALGVKGAVDKVVEIEAKIASLKTRRASIEKTIAALESPAGIQALEAEAAEYDAELKREADKAAAAAALKVAKAKHKAAVAALDAAQKTVTALDDDMSRTILATALRDFCESLIDSSTRHRVNDWRVESALVAAEARLKLAAEGKEPDSWIQPHAPAEPFDPLANMTPLGRALHEHRQFQQAINPPASSPAEAGDDLAWIDRARANGATQAQIEAAWTAANEGKAA